MERLEWRRDLHARGSGDVGARDLKITPSVICFACVAGVCGKKKHTHHVNSLIPIILRMSYTESVRSDISLQRKYKFNENDIGSSATTDMLQVR